MDKKLTLRLDADVIESAKAYARQHGESLSQMVERYFKRLTQIGEDEHAEEDLPPIVRQLSKSPPVRLKVEDLADDPKLEYIYNKHVK